jgi:TPR repeat protein
MFEVLNNCLEDYLNRNSHLQDSPSFSSTTLSRKHFMSKPTAYSIDRDAYALPSNIPDFESFNYMTLADAAKQHKLISRHHGKIVGDLKTAYKCFEAYANLGGTGTANHNQIKAKYYKAYYISKGFVESPPNKDKIVAELFKEVADDEANEFPEAKVRYGDCLYNGKGVEQNFSEALKYFEKAAENFKVAMYNTGNIYYSGIGGIKDKEKATYYMKLASYGDYEPATKFCKEHNL